MKFVKLCNFSCAVPIDGIRDDEEKLEDLKFLLPPRIVPPEVDYVMYPKTPNLSSENKALGNPKSGVRPKLGFLLRLIIQCN